MLTRLRPTVDHRGGPYSTKNTDDASAQSAQTPKMSARWPVTRNPRRVATDATHRSTSSAELLDAVTGFADQVLMMIVGAQPESLLAVANERIEQAGSGKGRHGPIHRGEPDRLAGRAQLGMQILCGDGLDPTA